MSETQDDIGQWAQSAFGPGDPADPCHSLRILKEVVELCLDDGASPAEILTAVGEEAGKVGKDAAGLAVRRPRPERVPAEAGDVAITLDVFAHRHGFRLQDQKDAKMKINRYEREWISNGDGTGRHRPKGGRS